MTIKNIKDIKKALTQTLPGWNAQKLMSPYPTTEYRRTPNDAKHASVMILLYPDKNEKLNTYYIKRTSKNPNDKHAGQISFPGGQKDKTDKDFIETALRETEEELGIDSSKIEILGHLTPLFVFASHFHVQPVVGYINFEPSLILQESEVEYPISIALEKLVLPETMNNKDYKIKTFVIKNMPYYNLNGEVLWGATAMMTSELVSILRNN